MTKFSSSLDRTRTQVSEPTKATKYQLVIGIHFQALMANDTESSTPPTSSVITQSPS